MTGRTEAAMTTISDDDDMARGTAAAAAPMPGRVAVSPDGGGGWRRAVVLQLLGLAAMAVVLGVSQTGKYHLLIYGLAAASTLLLIPKPNLAPYVFVASFFTVYSVYQNGRMLSVKVTDFMLIMLLFAFISRNKTFLKDAIDEHRRLLVLLALFMLWAIIGFFVNLYSHTLLENATSAFFIFNIAQLIAVVVLFSQAQCKPLRENILFFYLVCAAFEIAAAFGLRVLADADAPPGFTNLTGTLGPHRGMLANVMVLSIGVAGCAFFILKGQIVKLFAVCVCMASFGTLLMSGSRSSAIGLAFAMPATAFLGYRLRKRTLLLVMLSAAAALAVLWLSPLRQLAGAATNLRSVGEADMSAYGRLMIWNGIYEHALHGPWLQKIFGIGIGTFNTLKFSYFLEAGTFTTGGHNNFLHAFVEVGIVGMVVYSAILAEVTRRLIVMSRRGNNAARCFLATTLALLFSCLTQETLWFNTSFARFWMMHLLFYTVMFDFRGDRAARRQEKPPLKFV